MSRYGRIINFKTGHIIIADTGKNINRLVVMINDLDRKPNKADKEFYEKEYKRKTRLREIKAKHCSKNH